MAKYIKKGKVKNVYIFTEDELCGMWSLMHDGLKLRKKEHPIVAEIYEPFENNAYQLLKVNGYFDRLDEEYKNRRGKK